MPSTPADRRDRPSIAWHYTTGLHFKRIAKSGALLPIPTNGAPKHERPVIWFSTEPFWEPTANKGWMADGVIATLDMHGTHEKCGGLVRFGVPAARSGMHPFDAFVRMSGIPPKHAKGLVDVGAERGASPDRWLVCFDPIPTEECIIEVFDNGGWERVRDPARGDKHARP